MKKILLILFLSLFVNGQVCAFDFSLPNNKFGIHLAQPNPDDLEKASEMINANGGKWGYVTLVIQENDRDKHKWQEVFDRLRELHLIPLIRIATKPEGASWRRPQKEDVDEWVNFLSSLKWVVRDKYIIIFNEPNHATEWGGAVDPDTYAQIAKDFAQKLKEKNKDFFVMMAGFDASAPSSQPYYEDEAVFIKRVLNTISVSEFNKLFSGWVSHSYPNPAFAGSPLADGRGTVRTYQWELNFLKNIGVKELPVFITETGWDSNMISRGQIASNFQTTFQRIWLPDNQVMAVTPFVLSYLGEPFSNFSWVEPDNQNYYPQYQTVQNMPKQAGSPDIIDQGEISYFLPKEMVIDSTYHFKVDLKNTGEAIWDKNEKYRLIFTGSPLIDIKFNDVNMIKPNSEKKIEFTVKTSDILGQGKVKIFLIKESRGEEKKILTGSDWNFTVGPVPKLDIKTSFFPKLRSNAKNVEIQLFNDEEELVYKKKNVDIIDGRGVIEKISNVVIGKKYRIVILRSGYLPRQAYVTFKKGVNEAKFEAMLPLDFNNDGKLDMKDIQKLSSDLRLLSIFIF